MVNGCYSAVFCVSALALFVWYPGNLTEGRWLGITIAKLNWCPECRLAVGLRPNWVLGCHQVHAESINPQRSGFSVWDLTDCSGMVLGLMTINNEWRALIYITFVWVRNGIGWDFGNSKVHISLLLALGRGAHRGEGLYRVCGASWEETGGPDHHIFRLIAERYAWSSSVITWTYVLWPHF